MANFFGNSMFGHNFQATAFQQNYGNSRGSFSSKKPNETFGTSGFSHSGISSDHSGGGHETLGMHRQHSILSEMTRSKSDKSENPWLFAHTPGHVEDGAVLKLYEKPLEKEKVKKKPPLTRQSTFGVEREIKRAPSFASNPEKMRSRTISTSSAPDRFPLQRSMSIVDEPSEPLNMDRARPVLRRAMTIAADKERRKSEASIRPKKPLLHISLPKFVRRRSSTKSSPGTASPLSPNSETASLSSSPMRSRSNTSDDSRPSPSGLKQQIIESPKSKSKENMTDADEEQAKLILSLLNPDPEDEYNNNNEYNDIHLKENRPFEVPSKPAAREPQSPSTVSKRFHQLLPPELPDDSSLHSGQFSPRSDKTSISSKSSSSIPASRSSKASKPYPGKSFLDVPTLLPAERTDSESSESFYDCPPQNGVENGIPRRVKKKSSRNKRGSTSTCTDEDSNSTCDIIDPYEAETLPMRSRTVVPIQNGMESYVVPVVSQPIKARPSVKTYIYDSMPTRFENLMITVPNPGQDRISPKYEIKSESDPKDLHGNDTCTADSSESGYATSHKPLSPRDCDMKVLNFVNSLPSQPDINEEHSEVSHDDVLNGSETDTDTEEPQSPISNLSNVKCVSGSDTDAESICSNETNSKLEVMKLLESPTEVSNRVGNKLKTNNNNNKPASDDNNSDKFSVKRKGSDASQTEVLRPYKKEDDHPDIVSEKSVKIHETPVQAECVVIAKESSSPLESPTTETHVIKDRSNYSFFERPLLSFRSTYSYENLSKCTQCVDFILSGLNVILFLTSAAVIALALWLLMKSFNVNQMTEILGNNLLQVIIYLSITGASAAMLAALCLCCGMRQDKTGLGFYTFILVLVIFLFATAAVLSAVFADKLGSIEFRFNFRDRLVHKYGLNNEKINQVFTESWDKMQEEFECCGVEGNENDTHSWAVFKKFSKWYRHQPNKAMIYVPESCCKRNGNVEVCQGSDHSLLGPPVYGPPQEDYHTQRNPFLNTDGCYHVFAKHATAVVAWSALVTGGLAGLYFVVVMLTWVFCLKKPKEDAESYYDESYYDMNTHNEVFDENDGTHLRHRATKGKETESLLSQPVTVHRMPPASTDSDINRNMEHRNSGSVITEASVERENSDGYNYDSEDEDDSEDESDEDPAMDHVENGSSRRNQWLTSELGYVHLLSVAIEEEEDNFVDSDEELPKPNNMAFV